MAVTQKMYLGGVPVIKNYLGEDPIVSAGSFDGPVLSIDWLLIGGGGSGGTFNNVQGGSGGAGRFVSSSIDIYPQSITCTIGTGGAGTIWSVRFGQGFDGGQSSAVISGVTYTAPGGGGGGEGLNSGVTRNGKNGGSGGGTGGSGGTAGTNTAGSPISGFGNNGQVGSSGTGGNGGGAGGTPTGLAWLDTVTYAGGGGSGLTTAGSGTVGGLNGGNVSKAQDGIFIIRYLGETIKASGGTIIQNGGYTYHVFFSSGTFTYPA